MIMRSFRKRFVLFWLALVCLSLFWPLSLVAEEIYHWVDEQGVKHYSQSPPPVATKDVKTLDVDGSQPASYNPEEDRYNVAAQEKAMQAMRDEMAESRKNKQVAQQNSADTTVIYYPQEETYNDILYPPGYRPPRPPFPHPRPPRPPGSKPDRPGNLPADAPPPTRTLRPIRP